MRIVTSILLMLLLALPAYSQRPDGHDDGAELVVIAMQFIQRLDAGQFEAAREHFNQEMLEALDANSLQQLWVSLPAQVGARQSVGMPRVQQGEGMWAVIVPLQYASMLLDALVVFDENHAIAGFRLTPGVQPPPPPPESDNIMEIEFTVGPPGSQLPATITAPLGEGPFPVVVLVHGSGPHDRDQTVGPNRIFRDIAHGLAELGVASLRYEKRTLVYPRQFAEAFTVDDETVNDVVWAVRAVREIQGIDRDRVFIAGHSLGGMMAPRIATRVEGVAGLILMAAPARPLEDLILDQARYLVSAGGETNEAMRERLTQLERIVSSVKAVDSRTPSTEMLLTLPAAYWLDLKGYDPVAVVRGLETSTLVLHGGRDFQVTEPDIRRWRTLSNRRNVTIKEYPRLNHLFMPGEGRGLPADYMVPGQHFDAAVIEDIAQWVKGG